MKNLTFDAPTNKAVTTESSLLLDMTAKPLYKFVEFTNISSTDVYLAFNNNPAEVEKGSVIFPGERYVMIHPEKISYGKVNVISKSGGETVTITKAK